MTRTIENPRTEFNIILSAILAPQVRPGFEPGEIFIRHIE